MEVMVVARTQNHGEIIRKEGFKLIPLDTNRRSRNIGVELRIIWQLIHIFKREKPDIIHNIAIKPVIYGSLAALFLRSSYTVNSVNGLGYIFTTKQLIAKLVKPVFKLLFFILFNRTNNAVIVQNPDDGNLLEKSCLVKPQRLNLIRGSGVDMQTFFPKEEPKTPTKIIIMASRMIWDKGVGEFVEAARLLKKEGMDARFALVGESDPDNPAAVPIDQMEAWQNEKVIEWWGKRNDMPNVFAQCHVVCLPSAYGEGVPKVLIEAAACGRPIVTTNMPGCREIVRDNENGLLVPVRDVQALAGAIRSLVQDPQLRKRLGNRGREIAQHEFSINGVVDETLKVYRKLIR